MAKLHTLVDDFDDNSVDTGRWTQTNNTGTTGSESNQRYEFACASNGVAFSQLTSAVTYDLTGSHALSRLADAGNQSIASLEAYPLIVQLDGSNRLFFVVTSNLIGIYKVDGGAQTGLSFPAYDSSVHKWFRIRESGGTVYFDYSTDGVTWSNFTSTTVSFALTAVVMQLQAGKWGADPAATTVAIDDINNQPGIAGTAALAGSGTCAAAGIGAYAAAASLAGAGTMATTSALIGTASAALSGAGALAAGGLPVGVAAATLTGSGGLAADGLRIAAATAALSGTGQLGTTARYVAAGTAAMAGTGTLTAVARGTIRRPNTGIIARPNTGIVPRP